MSQTPLPQAAAIHTQGRKSVEEMEAAMPACCRIAVFQNIQKLVLSSPQRKESRCGFKPQPKQWDEGEKSFPTAGLGWSLLFLFFTIVSGFKVKSLCSARFRMVLIKLI